MTDIRRFRKPAFVAAAAAAIGYTLGGSASVDLLGVELPLWAVAGVTVGASSVITNGVVRPFLLEKFQGSDIAGLEVALGEPVLNSAIMYGISSLIGEPDIMTALILGGGSTIAGGYLEGAFQDY